MTEPQAFSAARALLLAMLLALLAGCKVALPFSGPAADAGSPRPGETAVLALTHVRLGSDRARNAVFWTHTNRVLDVVAAQPGYLGHSLRRELFGDEAWTMTMWRDEPSLRAFVQSEVHQAAIGNGLAAVASARFAHVTLERAAIPVSWEQAERILREHGRGY